MTSHENATVITATDVALGTTFKLAADFAAKKSLSADATYVVIGHKKIGKNEFCVAAAYDTAADVLTESAPNFNVQTKNMIIDAPITEEVADAQAPRVTAHSDCTHESTKSARATCRRARAAAAKNAAE